MSKNIKKIDINVSLVGEKPIIFNSTDGNLKDEKIPPQKRLPLVDNKVVITADRLLTFLIDNDPKNPPGVVKLVAGRQYKALINSAKAYVRFSDNNPLLCNGKEIVFKSMEKNPEIEVDKRVLKVGKPQLVERPMIKNWSVNFKIMLFETPDISFDGLKDWFGIGGIAVGLGASRPIFGQFNVEKFEIVK